MEWYKHKTCSLDDPDINQIMDEFGDAGYVMFFGFLEIYGREFNNRDETGFLWLNLNFIARKLRKNSAKVEKFLNFCEKHLSKQRFIVEYNKKRVGVKIPDFIDYSSNWAKRRYNTPTETPTETPTAIEVEEEVEEDNNTASKKQDAENNHFYLTKKKRKLNGKRLESFLLFWDAFDYKCGKAEAADSWLDIPQLTNSLVDKILNSAKRAAKNRPSIISSGTTPKMAQGWISASRWEDEPYKIPEPKKVYVDV